MFDVELNEDALEALIQKLDENNKNIVEAMNHIYSTMTKIEDNDWHSPEKERINNNFIPYLKTEKDSLNNNLYSKTTALKESLISYRQDDQSLKNETKNLEVIK